MSCTVDVRVGKQQLTVYELFGVKWVESPFDSECTTVVRKDGDPEPQTQTPFAVCVTNASTDTLCIYATVDGVSLHCTNCAVEPGMTVTFDTVKKGDDFFNVVFEMPMTKGGGQQLTAAAGVICVEAEPVKRIERLVTEADVRRIAERKPEELLVPVAKSDALVSTVNYGPRAHSAKPASFSHYTAGSTRTFLVGLGVPPVKYTMRYALRHELVRMGFEVPPLRLSQIERIAKETRELVQVEENKKRPTDVKQEPVAKKVKETTAATYNTFVDSDGEEVIDLTGDKR